MEKREREREREREIIKVSTKVIFAYWLPFFVPEIPHLKYTAEIC